MTEIDHAATTDTEPGEPAAERRNPLPGDGHMWVMVLGDLLIFGAYFVIFMVHRAMAPREFLAAQQYLNLDLGTLNTLVLLTSSWFVARSVHATRAGAFDRALRLIYAGAGLGVAFMGIKAYEWFTEATGGHTFSASEFFTFYYMLTGIHLFHVALGLLILAVVVRELRDPRRRRTTVAESGAVYWHMVDLLWIVIFALLYVMR
ncbi:cytochrome c oxidase subunit 3 [Nocardia sp. NPDC003345]